MFQTIVRSLYRPFPLDRLIVGWQLIGELCIAALSATHVRRRDSYLATDRPDWFGCRGRVGIVAIVVGTRRFLQFCSSGGLSLLATASCGLASGGRMFK